MLALLLMGMALFPGEVFARASALSTVRSSLRHTVSKTVTVNNGGGFTIPGTFTLTSATPSCSGSSPRITLNWTASSGVTSYDVYRNGSFYIGVLASDLSFLNSANVTPGTTYTYFIRAKNASGIRDSNSLQATAPSNCGGTLPGAFTLTSATPSCSGTSPRITLNWTASSGVTSYDIYRNGSFYIGVLASDLSFLNSSNVTSGTTYTYFIRAKNATGTRDSNSLQATGPSCVSAFTLSVASSNPNSGVYIYVGPNDNQGVADGTTSFSRLYNSGTLVTLIAPTTAGGNNFVRWTRNGVDYDVNRTTTVSMSANYTMTAVFAVTAPVTRTVTVTSSNPSSGVTIASNTLDNNTNAGGTTTFTRVFNQNATATYIAPATTGGNSFQKWQRDGSDLTTSTTASITMDANHTLTAVYAGSSGLSITTTSLNPSTAMVGTGYAAQQAIAATGGQTPYSWSASGLPNGMGINSSSGAIFGTPTVAGTFNFTVTVRDSSSPQKTASKVLSISVVTATTALQVSPGSGPAGTSFSFAGTGYTPNGTTTLTVTKPNGQAGTAKYSVNTSGKVSFIITSQQSDPLGQWGFRLIDDLSGKQASATVQYASSTASGTDQMYYTASTVDVTIPDNTQLVANETRNKVWRIQNTGTNAWSNYQLVYVQGVVNGNLSSLISSIQSLSINASVGQWINTPNLPITAPSTPGTYYSYWQMRNSAGVGFGPILDVKIRVVPRQGNALGFGTQSGRGGTNDSPPAKSARNADPVNTATGNYNYAATDLRVSGRGLDVEISRYYNSQDTTVGPLGKGWSHSFNIYLTNITASSASVHYSDGKVLDFTNQSGTNNFTSSYPGYYDVLIKNSDGTWSLNKTDQRSYRFDGSGKLSAIRDRNDNQISLSYSGGNLAQVTDTTGRVFNFSYSGSLLRSITDPGQRFLEFTYDGGSNLISFRDANGGTNSYSYDGSNQLTRIIDGRGNNLLVNSYTNNCPAGVISCVSTQTNGRGNQWTFLYNADGSTSVFDPLNKESKYVQDVNFNIQQTQDRNANSQFASGIVNLHYDESNNRDQISDQKGNPTAYVYDQNGNIVSRTDPTLTTRQAVYDSNNNPKQITDELGKTTQMAYDARGNLITLTDALSNSSTTTYDAFGQPLAMVDSNGNVSTRTYDANGNVTSVKDALNNLTTYAYDGVGRRTSMTDARGKITRYTYDSNDNLLTVTDPLGNVTAYSYDGNNNRVLMRDPRGNTTTYGYDENNLLIKETDARGGFIQHTYDKLDRRISTRDKRGNVTSFAYDNEGRLISATDPLGSITRYSYDANGNRSQVTDAKNQTTTFTYDALNRVTDVQDALGNTIQKTYDGAGRLAKEIDPRGNASEFTYDAVGNLTQVKDSAGGTAKYSYDKNQNRISQTDPNNRTSNLAYDKLNRLLSATSPLNHTSSFAYDEAGNRVSQTDAKGQTVGYANDGNNRLTVITYPNSSTVRFTRDANGNVTQMVDSLGTTSYAYDELNRVVSTTDPFGKTIGYQYDENGNITRVTYPDGKAVNYQFDANNRMVSFTDWAAKTTSLNYDSTNLLTRVTYPNGIATSFTYDNAGRLVAKSDAGISSYSFTLDKNGNRTSASVTQPSANRRQTNAQNYTYDAANRIQNAGSTTFAFDSNGNMTSKTEAGVATAYGYDFENRLVSVGNISQYFYNGEGVRLQKVEGGKSTRYVVDTNHELSQVLCETDANGAITNYYVYGFGLAYKVDPNGTHYYYHFDPLGSTIALTDDAKNVVNTYAYDPFGKVTNKTEGATNPFQFVGQFGVMQETNGLNFVRVRYYSAESGRFLGADPSERGLNETQELNLYVYANNNPVLLLDQNGKFPQIAIGFGLGALKGLATTFAGDVVTNLANGNLKQGHFRFSSGYEYAGAAIGGGIAGACLAATASIYGCSAIGEAADSASRQLLEIAFTDKTKSDFSVGSVVKESAISVLSTGIGQRAGSVLPRPVGRPAKLVTTKFITGKNISYYWTKEMIEEAVKTISERSVNWLINPTQVYGSTLTVKK